MKRFLLTIAFVFVASVAGAALRGATATAQPPDTGNPSEDRATSFKAMTGPMKESIAGGPLMLGAYAVAWAVVILLVWRVGQTDRETAARLARLEKALAARGPGSNAND
jgi:hypothetical protein